MKPNAGAAFAAPVFLQRKVAMVLVNMFAYYICAAIWLSRALIGHNFADYLVTFIFLCAGVTWTFRYVKQKNKDKE